MQILSKIPHFARKSPEDDTHLQAQGGAADDIEIQTAPAPAAAEAKPDANAITAAPEVNKTAEHINDYVPSPDAQAGVQKIEAVTLAWTKGSLAALLCL